MSCLQGLDALERKHGHLFSSLAICYTRLPVALHFISRHSRHVVLTLGARHTQFPESTTSL